jgi:tetratricopeptide (TPR) repeat protein
VAYGPGAIDWADGVAQAAAFVNTQDPRVVGLAHAATRAVPADAGAWGTRNVARMAAIVESLGEIGIAYVPDPRNPYARMSATPHAVDTVRYPFETLAGRSGDCDDTTVLLASLLGAVGIETQFADVPEHLFLLADSGLHARRRAALGLPDELTVVDHERVWIPIETTATSRGFATAWQEGAARYRDYADRGQVSLWNVQASQAEYPPAQPPVPVTQAAALDAGALQGRCAAAATTVGAWRDTHWSERYGDLASPGPVSAAARLELARVHMDAGELETARDHLERALDAAPAAAHNGLAVLEARRGDVRAAIAQCGSALRADSTDAGVWWNWALLQRAAGDTVAAARAARETVRRGGGPVATCRLLEIAPPDSADAIAPPLAPAEAERLLERALRDVPVPAAGDSGAAARTGQTPLAPRRVGGSRGSEDGTSRIVYYWKEVGS